MKDIIQILKDLKIKFKEDIDLSKLSTMRVGGKGKVLVDIENLDQIKLLVENIDFKTNKTLIIGEGSNTLFADDFDGIILRNKIENIEIIEENNDFISIEAGGGYNWHEFIRFCVDRNLAGNENLAYIPGTVGAAPVQNIAAYGQTQEDTFLRLKAIDLHTGKLMKFEEPQCEFEYRNSIFKKKYKNQLFIYSVTYQLKKIKEYTPDTSYYSRYESLAIELTEVASEPYTPKDVFNAVTNLRKKKLPQVEEVGTLGSFFLNPFITKEKLEEIQKDFPGIQFYPVDKMQYPGLDDEILKSSDIVKIPAGWLLEELGWRGKEINHVSASPKHALCITALSGATSKDVSNYIELVKKSVKEKTGITLETEINIIK